MIRRGSFNNYVEKRGKIREKYFKKYMYCFYLGNPRTATGMDGTLPHCNFENLKPVEISKNHLNII